MKALVLGSIRLYQVAISPYWPGSCRHDPTCSTYAREAVVRHGVAKGLRLVAGRLARCRPFGTSGYDPVPR